MLEISVQAFSSFSSVALSTYLERLAVFLVRSVPGLEDVPRDELLSQLHGLVRQAQSFGIHSEQGVAAYAVTAGQLGLDFVEKFPGARQIVDANIPEGQKINLLEAFTINILEILES